MRINKNAKYGLIKEIDKDHEIAIASDGKNKQIIVKCLAKDLRRKNYG